MSMTDPIADLLTRMRNVNRIKRKKVSAPYSRIKEEILKTLLREGFIAGYEVTEKDGHKNLAITMKFGAEGEFVINEIQRVSRPGQRVYRKVGELVPLLKGMGIWIVSTPRGILSDNEARSQKVGGEVLCSVY